MTLTIRGDVEVVDKDNYEVVLAELHAGDSVTYEGHLPGGNILIKTSDGEVGVIGAAGTVELI